MGVVLTTIKIILFVISSFGYWKLINKKTKIDIHFIPMLTIATQVFILMIAGMLNILLEISCIIYFGGFLLFIHYLIKDKKEFLGDFKSWDFLVIGIVFLIIGIALKGKTLVEYDNYTHWGLVVKNMLSTNQFPNFQDTLIEFTSYPLGSSSFVYFFSRFIDNGEAVQILGQQFISIMFLLPILKYIKKYRIPCYIAFVVFINFILVYEGVLNGLLVDKLLAFVAFGSVLFIYDEGIKNKNLDIVKFLAPVISFIILIKTSGIFFAVLEIILVLYLVKKEKKFRNLKVLFAILSPFIMLFIWNKHCSYVFENSNASRHALTLENSLNVFKGKTWDDILQIGKNLLKRSFIGQEVLLLGIFTIYNFITAIILDKKGWKKSLKLLLIEIAIYIVYIIGMFAMYVISMPTAEEAIKLASFVRYRSTVVIFIYTMIFTYQLKLISESKIKDLWKMIIAWIMPFVIVGITYFKTACGYKTIFDTNYNGNVKHCFETRKSIEKIIKENNLTDKNKIVIVTKKSNGKISRYILRYLLMNKNNAIIYKEDLKSSDLKEYDFVMYI